MGYFFYPLSPSFFLIGGVGGGGRDTEKKYYLTKFTGLQEHIEYVT